MRSKDSAFDITALDLSELAGFFNLSPLGIYPHGKQSKIMGGVKFETVHDVLT